MNEATQQVLGEILADLASDDAERRQLAAEALRLLGADVVSRCVAPLIACLDDESLKVRSAAAWALLGASPIPKEFVPFLMNALLSPHATTRAWCCSLLGESGTSHPGVRRALAALADGDPDSEVRWRAERAVEELDQAGLLRH